MLSDKNHFQEGILNPLAVLCGPLLADERGDIITYFKWPFKIFLAPVTFFFTSKYPLLTKKKNIIYVLIIRMGLGLESQKCKEQPWTMRPKARVLALIAFLSSLTWGGLERSYRYVGLKWRSVPLALAWQELQAESVQLLVYSTCTPTTVTTHINSHHARADCVITLQGSCLLSGPTCLYKINLSLKL